MKVSELKKALADVPDDVEVYLDLGGINAIGASAVELDEYQYAFFIY